MAAETARHVAAVTVRVLLPDDRRDPDQAAGRRSQPIGSVRGARRIPQLVADGGLEEAMLAEERFELRHVDIRELNAGPIERLPTILARFDENPHDPRLARQSACLAGKLELHGAVRSYGAWGQDLRTEDGQIDQRAVGTVDRDVGALLTRRAWRAGEYCGGAVDDAVPRGRRRWPRRSARISATFSATLESPFDNSGGFSAYNITIPRSCATIGSAIA
jgi:hypothetical protein